MWSFTGFFFFFLSFPGGSDGRASACDVGDRVWSLGQEDPLEKETATHSSTLAWKIPWMEEPGGLQSMGSQRIGHDWATSLHFTSFLKTLHGLVIFTTVNQDTEYGGRYSEINPLFHSCWLWSPELVTHLSLGFFHRQITFAKLIAWNHSIQVSCTC